MALDFWTDARTDVLVKLWSEGLADAIGVTFQQVQKYEKAANRVPVGRLVGIARALGCRPATLLPEEA